MPSWIYSLDLDSICENLNWLLSMNVHRVSDSKLTILVETGWVDFAWFRQEERVELASSNLLDLFSIKIWIIIVPRSNFISSRISVKNLTVLWIHIPMLPQLISCVLPKTKGPALAIDKALMLKSRRHAFHINLCQRFDKSRFFSVDIIVLSKLTGIIVPPRIHMILFIDHRNVTCSETHVFHWILKSRFNYWLINPTFEKRCKTLNTSNKSRYAFPLFNKSVSRSRAKRPSPK